MKFNIAYGSNLSVEQMAFRCPDAIIAGKAVLHDWKLADTYQRLQTLPIRIICPGHGHPIENVTENFEMLCRKLRKFAAAPDLVIVNNLIPTVEHYINDHPGVTQQKIVEYFAVKYEEMQHKGFLDFDKPVSPYSVIMNKVLMMMQYLQMVYYDDDGTAHLSGEVNHYIKG